MKIKLKSVLRTFGREIVSNAKGTYGTAHVCATIPSKNVEFLRTIIVSLELCSKSLFSNVVARVREKKRQRHGESLKPSEDNDS